MQMGRGLPSLDYPRAEGGGWGPALGGGGFYQSMPLCAVNSAKGCQRNVEHVLVSFSPGGVVGIQLGYTYAKHRACPMTYKMPTREAYLLNDMLLTSAGVASKLIDSFSGWLLGGYGAFTALFLSQYDALSKHLGARSVRWTILLFGIVLLLGMIEKYISFLVAGATAGAEESRKTVGRQNLESPVDAEFVLDEIEKAMLWPARWFVHRSIAKAKTGDIVSSARKFMKLAQVQGMVLVAQVAAVLATAGIIGFAFRY